MKKTFFIALMLVGIIGKAQTSLYKPEFLDIHNVMLKSAMEYPYIYDYNRPTIIGKIVDGDTLIFNILEGVRYFYVPFYENLKILSPAPDQKYYDKIGEFNEERQDGNSFSVTELTTQSEKYKFKGIYVQRWDYVKEHSGK